MNEEQYIAALMRHDWQFEATDDFAAYLRGRTERKKLEEAAKELDPDKALWKMYAPKSLLG